MGAGGRGRCWDPIADQPGKCRRRYCRAGWTCACAGRTHLCQRSPRTVNSVDPVLEHNETASCTPKTVNLVSGRELELGSFWISISRDGVKENSCNQLTWWHNGMFRGDWPKVSGLSDTEVDKVLEERSTHTLLEMRPGDLLAFQFIDASYYCYKHFAKIVVNGIEITTEMTGVNTYYSREYTPNWFDPGFTLNGTRVGLDESEVDLRKFLPRRKIMIESGAEIEPGIDYWAPEDPNSRDHKKGDWFWRIQLPTNIPSSFTF